MASIDLTGRYWPGHSFWHQRDARVKLGITLAWVVIGLKWDSAYTQMLLFVALLMLFVSSRLPIDRLFQGLKTFRWLFIVTFAVNLLAGKGERVWPPLPIRYDGLEIALIYGLRLMNLIGISIWLMMTVRPLDLIGGLEKVFSPLKPWVPVSEFVLAMGIAIRFFPLLLEEGEEILLAQRARGARFHGINGLKMTAFVAVPLFIGALRRAGDLADAMTARGYRSGRPRTDWQGMNWHWKDTLVLVIATGIGIIGFVSKRGFW